MTPEQTAQVRALNDLVRTDMKGGRWVATSSVRESRFYNAALLVMIARFDAFTQSADPHGLHDMGVIEIEDTTIWFKIDIYEDAECQYGAEQPWNPDCSYRVLTILFPNDY